MHLLERWDDLSRVSRTSILIWAIACFTIIAIVALLVLSQVLVTAGI